MMTSEDPETNKKQMNNNKNNHQKKRKEKEKIMTKTQRLRFPWLSTVLRTEDHVLAHCRQMVP